MKKEIVKDHLGNEFPSTIKMCTHYGVSIHTYRHRIKQGYSLEEALTTEVRPRENRIAKDHLGNAYATVRSMCKHYDIPKTIYTNRYDAGFSIKEALLNKVDTSQYDNVQTICTDHLGRTYENLNDMCNKYHINKNTYYTRMLFRWDLKTILTFQPKDLYKPIGCYDHLYNRFNSLGDMCDYYNITYKLFHKYIEDGLTIDKALSTAKIMNDYVNKREHPDPKQVVDHLGNIYPSISLMCQTYGIPHSTYNRRKKNGASLEEILTSKYVYSNREVHDHLGNKYHSLSAMCRHYNVSVWSYTNRLQQGQTIKEALGSQSQAGGYRKNYKCKDHLGNTYNSLNEMCEHYGITISSYYYRLRHDWSLEKTLTTHRHKYNKNEPNDVIDHLGNKYLSIIHLCEHYGITVSAYYYRKSKNWDLEKILTTPMHNPITK